MIIVLLHVFQIVFVCCIVSPSSVPGLSAFLLVHFLSISIYISHSPLVPSLFSTHDFDCCPARERESSAMALGVQGKTGLFTRRGRREKEVA